MGFYSAKQIDVDTWHAKSAMIRVQGGQVHFVAQGEIEERAAAIMAYRAQELEHGADNTKLPSLVIPWHVEACYSDPSADSANNMRMLQLLEEGRTRFVWSDSEVLQRNYGDAEVSA